MTSIERPLRRRPLRGGAAGALIALSCLAVASACASRTGSATFDLPLPEERDLSLQERLAPDDGTIVSVVDTGIARSYGEIGPEVRARFDEGQWERARAGLDGRADLVTYSSDGLRVGGLLVRPRSTEGRRLPAVVVNRDGIANRGLDEDAILADLERYAQEGFVAAASAYRGNRLSQGVDELGGDDVSDVLSLIALLQRLDYVDPSRIFMVGYGRGGLMTYRAIEMGAPIRAAAVVAGLADVDEQEELDIEIANGFADSGGWPGLAEIHGGWGGPERRIQLERRNPRIRADGFEVPLLVIHGRDDAVVPVAQAICVATRVRKNGTPLEAVIYGYGDHSLLEQRADWQARVMAWLERHDTRSMVN